MMALENSDVPGYVTEKMINAFLSGAIPISWGAAQTVRELFNPSAYVDVSRYSSPAAAAQAIVDIANNPVQLRAMRAQPVSHNLDAINAQLRWMTNNASAFPAEVAVFRERLTNKWRMLVQCQPSSS